MKKKECWLINCLVKGPKNSFSRWRNRENNMILTLESTFGCRLFQFHFIYFVSFHLFSYFNIFTVDFFHTFWCWFTLSIFSVLFLFKVCLWRPRGSQTRKSAGVFCLLVTQLPCREQKHWCRKPCSCVCLCVRTCACVCVCAEKTPPTDTQPPGLHCSCSCSKAQ